MLPTNRKEAFEKFLNSSNILFELKKSCKKNPYRSYQEAFRPHQCINFSCNGDETINIVAYPATACFEIFLLFPLQFSSNSFSHLGVDAPTRSPLKCPRQTRLVLIYARLVFHECVSVTNSLHVFAIRQTSRSLSAMFPLRHVVV